MYCDFLKKKKLYNFAFALKIKLMKQDLQIFSLIKKEEERQTSGIELIASENHVSNQVL